MAGCEEWANFEEVPPNVREGSKKRRVMEFVESWFVEQALAKDEEETWIDFGKRLSSEFMMPLKEKVDKTKLVAVEALDGEMKRFSGAAAASETATEEIQTAKMDKAKHAAAKASGGEKMDEGAESDRPAGVNGKHRLPEDYVTLVLAMPRETPVDTEDLSFITDLAKLLNRSEEWIEERKQKYMERAALSKRINDQFVQFQDSIRDKWINQGYVEAEGDYDDNIAEMNEYSRQLWKKHNDFSGLV